MEQHDGYEATLRLKLLKTLQTLHKNGVKLAHRAIVFQSPLYHFRMRGYFDVHLEDGCIHYTRAGSEPYYARQHVGINRAMVQVQEALVKFGGLSHSLEEILFHASSSGEVLVLFGYRRRVPSSWAQAASELHERFGFHAVGSVIGRSWWARREGRISVAKDFVVEKFDIQGTRLLYLQVKSA